MWQMICSLVVFGSVPYFMRRMETRILNTNGPKPEEWTMRQDKIASFARPDALEKDIWADKRKSLDIDFWADARRSRIDAEIQKKVLYSNPARRKKLANATHDKLRPGPNSVIFIRPRNYIDDD